MPMVRTHLKSFLSAEIKFIPHGHPGSGTGSGGVGSGRCTGGGFGGLGITDSVNMMND